MKEFSDLCQRSCLHLLSSASTVKDFSDLCQRSCLHLLSSASTMKVFGDLCQRSSGSTSNLSLRSFSKPRQFVSLWTCSKLCTICFAVGVVAGFTLKRRVRRWASKLLRRIKDN